MNNNAMHRYEINQCALYKCSNKKRLEHLLLLKENELKQIKEYVRYYNFSTPKKDGSPRKITAPCDKLKRIQRRILRLLSPIKRPDWLISGERGKSYIDNGKSHIDSKYFLAMDIKSFYPNCQREYVFRFFTDVLYTAPDIAKILTDIITYNGGIPTGCPTSQLIAYYAYENMFKEIYEIALKYHCKFTLYVDDMTFSSNFPFNPKKLEQEIDIQLRRYKHKPKYSKVKYYPANTFKLVTGTTVSPDNQLLVTNNLRQKIVVNFKELKKNHGLSEDDRKKKIDSLKGQIQAARNVNEMIFPEINRLINDLK